MAVVYHKSMIVYGGQTETGVYVHIMAVLHLDYLEWIRINLKTNMAPFICGAACAVTLTKKQQEQQKKDLSKIHHNGEV